MTLRIDFYLHQERHSLTNSKILSSECKKMLGLSVVPINIESYCPFASLPYYFQ